MDFSNYITWSNATDVATIIGVGLAIFQLFRGVYEYRKQGTQKRAEQFIEMRKKFKENDTFSELAAMIEINDPKLKCTEFKDKRDYLGFFEEVALMVNSGLIKIEVAHYMFGYYAIRCWDNNDFWGDVNRDSPYWALFKDFANRMKKQEDSFNYHESESNLRF